MCRFLPYYFQFYMIQNWGFYCANSIVFYFYVSNFIIFLGIITHVYNPNLIIIQQRYRNPTQSSPKYPYPLATKVEVKIISVHIK